MSTFLNHSTDLATLLVDTGFLVGILSIIAASLVWLIGILRWVRQAGPEGSTLPPVSVIIAGRNEEVHIRTALRSVLDNDYPADRLQVCFIDDHSDDRTKDFARDLLDSHPNLVVLSAPSSGPPTSPKKAALAHGIEHTSNEILLFTDADSQVRPGWVRAMAGLFDAETGAVAGATMPVRSNSVHHRLYRLERFMVALTSASAIGHQSPASVTGQNFAFRRSVYESVGGYARRDWPSGDDDLMVQAIARRGWKVRFCSAPESVVTDLRPPTVAAHAAAAVRHQSTVRFYPWRWRLVYLASIVAGLTLPACIVAAVLEPSLIFPAVAAVLVKLTTDGFAGFRFARQLRIDFVWSDFVLSELLLPAYSVLRPAMSLRRSYAWKDRYHRHPRSALT